MSQIDHRIKFVEECTSTNDLAHLLDDADAVSAVVANHQTNGRGRQGRAWISEPEQGLYLSWVCTPSFPASQGGTIPLLAAVAVYDLCVYLGVSPTLKWPNDILLNRSKLAGILCEARVQGEEWRAIVGIGLNLTSPRNGWPKDLLATGLKDHVKNIPSRDELASELLDRLEQLMDLANANGTDWVIEQWQARGCDIGTLMECQGYAGRYLGLTSDGSIRLDGQHGERVFSSGDITIA